MLYDVQFTEHVEIRSDCQHCCRIYSAHPHYMMSLLRRGVKYTIGTSAKKIPSGGSVSKPVFTARKSQFFCFSTGFNFYHSVRRTEYGITGSKFRGKIPPTEVPLIGYADPPFMCMICIPGVSSPECTRPCTFFGLSADGLYPLNRLIGHMLSVFLVSFFFF